MLECEQSDDFKNLSDIELVKLYKQGNQLAFQQLAVRYIFIIRNKSSDLYNMGIESEDLFQEGLLGLHNAVRSFDENGGASFKAYAAICIRNRLVSVVRAANTNKNKINNISVSLEEKTALQPISMSDPEIAVIVKEDFYNLVSYLKNNLSEMELAVLSMYIEGSSYDKIARALGVTKKVCNNAMQRVRKKLRIMN